MVENTTYTSTGLLRYPGGKTRAVKRLEAVIPDNTSTMLSPFFGGGALEIHCAAQGMKVQGYDVFTPLAHFWETVLSTPKELAHTVQEYYNKGVSKHDFLKLREILKTTPAEQLGLHHAAMFYVVNRCSFSGATLSGGYSSSAATQRFTQSSVDRIRNFHNPNLNVACGDAFEILENPSTNDYDLVFLDPPYQLDDSFLYGVNGDAHKGFDHERLAELVRGLETNVILTYNDSPVIRQLYQGYSIEPLVFSYGMSTSKKSKDIVIKNS